MHTFTNMDRIPNFNPQYESDDSDDCEDSENSRVWTNLVAATDTSIIILSLTHWNITYRLDLILPDDQVTTPNYCFFDV